MTRRIMTGNIMVIHFYPGIEHDTAGGSGDPQTLLETRRSSRRASTWSPRDARDGLSAEPGSSRRLGLDSGGMRPRAGYGERSIHLYI